MNTLRASLGLTKDQLPDPTKIAWENDTLHLEADNYSFDISGISPLAIILNPNLLMSAHVDGYHVDPDTMATTTFDGSLQDIQDNKPGAKTKTEWKSGYAGNNDITAADKAKYLADIKSGYQQGGVNGVTSAVWSFQAYLQGQGKYDGMTITGGIIPANPSDPGASTTTVNTVIFDETVTNAWINGNGGWSYDMQTEDLTGRENNWRVNSNGGYNEPKNAEHEDSGRVVESFDANGNPVSRQFYVHQNGQLHIRHQ